MNKYRYIVVEDEQLICQNIIQKIETLNSKLEFCGSAEDGEKALSLIAQQNPHIVFTDIKMPVMDGLMLAKELYFAYPQIKIVVISGYNDFEFAKGAIKYGASDFLIKPLDITELRECVLRILGTLNTSDNLPTIDSPISPILNKNELANYVEAFIQDNFQKNISLGEISLTLGYSPDYISKVFKKEKNITPIKFITKLRIDTAKQLLRTTDYDILTISQLIGYTDQFYFSRIFKRQTGSHPSDYRKQK